MHDKNGYVVEKFEKTALLRISALPRHVIFSAARQAQWLR
jgi:hypothetical protein